MSDAELKLAEIRAVIDDNSGMATIRDKFFKIKEILESRN